MPSQEPKRITLLPLDDNQKMSIKQTAESPTGNHAFPFRLSSQASPGWISTFNGNWSKKKSGGVSAQASTHQILLICAAPNLPEVFEVLKSVVEETNKQVLETYQRESVKAAEEQKRKNESKHAAQQALDEAFGKIKY